ncbi:MAG: hypothetical protein HQL38_07895 [Alphaproteobacteria bacterium]|nr:hypothetical protein [Alphaproteobacteria bacterium]
MRRIVVIAAALVSGCGFLRDQPPPPPPTPIAAEIEIHRPHPFATWRPGVSAEPAKRGGAAIQMAGIEHVWTIAPANPALADAEPPVAGAEIEPPPAIAALPDAGVAALDWLAVMARYCRGEAMSELDWRVIDGHGGRRNVPPLFAGACNPLK